MWKGKGRKPNLDHLKMRGCLAKVKILENKQRKLGPKTIDRVFIWYAQNSTSYIIMIIKWKINEIDVNSIIESRDVVFLENTMPLKDKVNNSFNPSSNNYNIDDFNENTNSLYLEESRRSKIQRIMKTIFISIW